MFIFILKVKVRDLRRLVNMNIFSVVVSSAAHKLRLILRSGDDTETDSEVEDRVDGVKSWLSKNKASSKMPSDEGSLKSARLVLTCSCIMTDQRVHPRGEAAIKLAAFPAVKRPGITWGRLQQKDGYFM